MAKLSESLFQSIRDFGKQDPTQPARRLAQASPYRQVGTTDPLARRVGSLFDNLGIDTSYMQTASERISAANEGLDMSTLEGQQQAIANEMEQVVDPQAHRALGLRMMELNRLKQAQTEAAIKNQQKVQKQEVVVRIADQFRPTDPLMADSIEAGLVDASQAMTKLSEKSKNEKAMEGSIQEQLSYLNGVGIPSDSWLYKGISDGTLANLSVTERASAIAALLEDEEVKGLLELPELAERPDVRELLENNLINSSAAKTKLRAPKADLSYSNAKWMTVGGKRSFVADVKPSTGDEYFGSFNAKTGLWEKIDPSKATPIKAKDKQKEPSYKNVGASERKQAQVYLQRLGDSYNDLDNDIKANINFDTANLASQLMSERSISQEQAMEEAATNIMKGVVEVKGRVYGTNTVYERPDKPVSRQAGEYINEVIQGS